MVTTYLNLTVVELVVSLYIGICLACSVWIAFRQAFRHIAPLMINSQRHHALCV